MIQCNLTEYQLEIYNDASSFYILLKHKIYCVGKVEGELNRSHQMCLTKIEIFEKAVYTGHNLLTKILQKPPAIFAPGYRGRGLASILLIALIEFAYEQRVNYIWGSVKSSGGLDDASLVTWFQRYGFQTSEPTEKNLPGAIAHIQFDF